jgi:hypothetical protein
MAIKDILVLLDASSEAAAGSYALFRHLGL